MIFIFCLMVVFLRMNFLAHAHLSFGHPQILVGNMISDFVKGKAQYDFDEEIRHGIILHRKIDAFTDTHDATKAAKEFFRADYRLYSGPLIDILYDHFLANDKAEFPGNDLFSFSENVYTTLESNSVHLPSHFLTLLPYMRSENWLYYYKDREGIARSIRGLVRRATYLSDDKKALELFNEHYNGLRECYNAFFKDVKEFTKDQVESLLS
jgi:acyl carrier protein phosphodiesterase